MATTIETTKLYINGEKVFPSSSSSLTADYTPVGYIPEDIAYMQAGYDLILSRKTTDISSLAEEFGHKMLAYPNLQISDYEGWEQNSINFDNGGKLSDMNFTDGKLNIKFVGNPYEHGVAIRHLDNLKELLLDNHCNFAWGEGLCRENPNLEKVTINAVGVENPEDREMNFENAFQEDYKLKEITINWQDMSPFYYSKTVQRLCYQCRELKKFNNNSQIDFSNIYFDNEGISLYDMFSECWSMETIPQITGYYNGNDLSTMFVRLGTNYKNDSSKRCIDYEIDGIREGVNMHGMFAGCALIRNLTIHGENKPSNGDILGSDHSDWNEMNFDGSVPIYEENSSNIVGYYIPDTFTQTLCTKFHLYVHPNNVEWWKSALSADANEVLRWYINNGMVQSY